MLQTKGSKIEIIVGTVDVNPVPCFITHCQKISNDIQGSPPELDATPC
jgi:hypothetical protein